MRRIVNLFFLALLLCAAPLPAQTRKPMTVAEIVVWVKSFVG
jgi:hypothetical protein